VSASEVGAESLTAHVGAAGVLGREGGREEGRGVCEVSIYRGLEGGRGGGAEGRAYLHDGIAHSVLVIRTTSTITHINKVSLIEHTASGSDEILVA